MIERQDLYEITLILKEGSDIGVVEKIVAEHGEIKKTTDLQVKQFAYPIGKLTSGHYVAFEFVAETSEVKKLETEIRAEKSVIRQLVTKAIRKNPEPIRTGEYAKKPETAPETAEVKAEPVVETPVKETPVEEIAPQIKLEETPEVIEKPAPVVAEEVQAEEPVVTEPIVEELEAPAEEPKAEPRKSPKKSLPAMLPA
jgi:ribosomal protein S6